MLDQTATLYEVQQYKNANKYPRLISKILVTRFKLYSFHIPNWKWLLKAVRYIFKPRCVRGRGKRTGYMLQYNGVLYDAKRVYRQDLPLRLATRLHVYINR